MAAAPYSMNLAMSNTSSPHTATAPDLTAGPGGTLYPALFLALSSKYVGTLRNC